MCDIGIPGRLVRVCARRFSAPRAWCATIRIPQQLVFSPPRGPDQHVPRDEERRSVYPVLALPRLFQPVGSGRSLGSGRQVLHTTRQSAMLSAM